MRGKGTWRITAALAALSSLVQVADAQAPYSAMPPTAADLLVLPDQTGDGKSDLAVMRDGLSVAEVRDGVTGALLRSLPFFGPGFTPVAAATLPDTDGDGRPELAVLATRDSDDRTVAEIRNVGGSDVVRTIWFSAGITPIGMASIEADADGNGVPELAVLATRDSDGRGLVEVKNAYGSTNPRSVWNASGYTPLDLEVVPDSDGNTIPEVAVLSRRNSDGRIVVEIKNAAGPTNPSAVWFMAGNTAIDLAIVGDKDGNGVPEVAVLSKRNSDSRLVTEVKNVRGPTNPSAVWFAAAHTGLVLRALDDADGNNVPEIAVLSRRDSDGRILVEVKNATGPTNPRSLWYPPEYTAVDLAILDDVDSNGIQEAGVLMIRDSDGRFVVQSRNAAGTQAPRDYWFSPLPTVSLTASQPAVAKGSSATLEWTSNNTTSCEAGGGWEGVLGTSGSETVGPLNATTKFTLACGGIGGTAQSSVTVQVNTVSGTIFLPAYSRYDRDTNDTNGPYQSNDDLPNAQPLPNPVRLGGYVNEALKGPEGRSYQSGDLSDVYSVSMAAGQVVELAMPTADETLGDDLRDDADLYLYLADANNPGSASLVATSMELGQLERVVAPQDGRYYVEVYLYTGAVIYNLSVGQQSPASSLTTGTLNVANDFRPGEAIVKLKSDLSQASAESRLEKLESRLEIRLRRGAKNREMLFDLPARASEVLRGRRPLSATVRQRGWNVAPEMQRRLDTVQFIKLLRTQDDVESADINLTVRSQAVPNDPLYGAQRWHYEMMALPSAWNVTTGSPEVVVAVVDSGVVYHPDLVPNMVAGYDFISDPSNDDGDGIDPDADDPGCVLGGSSSFHGTHVAGTVAAASNNGVGVAGVSWSSKIMPVRVLNGCEGSGSSYDVLQGIRFAAGLSNDSGQVPAKRADIINLSLGSLSSCPTYFADLFNAVRAQGVITVAAAGNDNSSLPHSPSSCANVISVSALDPTRSRAYYSNYGSTVDVAAPGGDMRFDRDGDRFPDGILSTVAIGGGANRTADYVHSQGTSMASPAVAGVIALMKAVKASLTPADVDNLLSQGQLTDDIGPAGPDELGVGLINALKALEAAGSTPSTGPVLTVTPSVVNFGDVATDAEVILANGGSGSLTLTTYTRSASWMELFNIGADPTTFLGPWLIRVDRTGLNPGIYQGWMDFNWSNGGARVNLTMEVPEVATVPDAGFQYVLLMTADTDELGAVAAGHLKGAPSLSYFFNTALMAQDYLLYSGTDMNNDRYICDDGEACGAHPTELRPEQFRVEGDTTGVDFATGFRTSVELSTATMAPLRVRDIPKLPGRLERRVSPSMLQLGD